MTVDTTWNAFKQAVANRNPNLALGLAKQLDDEMRASGQRPPDLRKRTLAEWSADNPNSVLPVASKVVRSLDPELRHLLDYLLVAVDEGEGISLLVPIALPPQ